MQTPLPVRRGPVAVARTYPGERTPLRPRPVPGPLASAPSFPARPVVPAFVRESGIVTLAVIMYFFVRGLMSSSHAVAVDHARMLIDVERWLGIAREADIQRWAENVPGLMSIMNSVYIYGHWPVVGATLVWLVWRHRDVFPIYRNTLLLSGMVGIVIFLLFPMSPPRFMTELGFVDTIMRDTEAYRVLQPPAFTNQYAAMPSLHVGWNLLMGIAIFRHSSWRGWRVFAVVMPLAMWSATVVTANHFILDGVIGSALVVAALLVASRLRSPNGANL